MSSAAVLVLLPIFLQSIKATVFPPVSNPPPVPNQAIRTLDTTQQRFYVLEDLQSTPPQTVIKEQSLPPDPRPDDQRWFVSENQSGEADEFPNSAADFERYYSNGLPAVGPVATPLPDETYVAQPSGTLQMLPGQPTDVRPADIWVLTKGPNNQYIPERWVPIQIPSQELAEAVSQGTSSKIFTDAGLSVPSIPLPAPALKSEFPPAVKSQFPPAAPASVVRQVWVRAPAPVTTQKVYQNVPTAVQDIQSIKQVVDIPPPANVKQIVDIPPPPVTFKQTVQPQFTKDLLDQPPPQSIAYVPKSSGSFALPPLPPPVFKSLDYTGSKKGAAADNTGYVIGKDETIAQVKHIWIPTSQNTGKFISIPVSSSVDSGKTGSAKEIPFDSSSTMAVSDTWVLKQDGPVPRFESQKYPFPVPAVQDKKVIVEQAPVVEINSPKNSPLNVKYVDGTPPVDLWPVKNGGTGTNYIGKTVEISAPDVSIPSKTSSVVIDKTLQKMPPSSQKTFISSENFVLPALSPPTPPFAAVVNGKPCPFGPQKSFFPQKSLALGPAPQVVTNVRKQPFSRIVRVNRYPYGPYYVLSPKTRTSSYEYPRQAVSIIRQSKNGIVRFVPSRQFAVTAPVRQVAAIPLPFSKNVVPLAYSPFQPVSRIRYTYPWNGYLRQFPIPGQNVFSVPQEVPKKESTLKSSSTSSESSSSESLSSENASSSKKKSKKKEKEPEKVAEKESEKEDKKDPEKESESANSSSSEEKKPEKEVESETVKSEIESEEVAAESELKEIMDFEESQYRSQYLKVQESDLKKEENLGLLPIPFILGLQPKVEPGTGLNKVLPGSEGSTDLYSYDIQQDILPVSHGTAVGNYESQAKNNKSETSHNFVEVSPAALLENTTKQNKVEDGSS